MSDENYYIVIAKTRYGKIWSVVPSHIRREDAMEWPILRGEKWGWWLGGRKWAEKKARFARWWLERRDARDARDGPDSTYVLEEDDLARAAKQAEKELKRLQKELERRQA